MWSQESERYLSWPRQEDRREAICQWAARYTNRNHPNFNFHTGMACYALAYLIDRGQGLPLTSYAQGILNHWGRRFILG